VSEAFDYVIIGAGSAGCVMANRLSRNPKTSVLLLESGPPDKSLFIRMPLGVSKVLAPGGPFVSTYEALTSEGRRTEPWVKGKTLGGSSSVNGMIYSRGHPKDFDDWESMGCTGWGWNHIGACYSAIEDHELGRSECRGVGGPLHLTIHRPRSELCDAILAAANHAGTPTVEDINQARDGGFGYQPRNVWNGERQSAATAFLHPVMTRRNLQVRTRTQALKVLFDGRRAIGVLVRDSSGERVIRANEIVLSAGAIESPKLLQLSGVGDGKLLQSLEIPVVVDSPEVGRNLREHIYLQAQYRVTGGSINAKVQGLQSIANGVRYVLFGTGVLADAAHALSGFVKTRPQLDRPDAHLGVCLFSMAFTDKGFAFDSKPGITFGGYQMRPQSRGEIKVVSRNPDVAPAINANYLAEEVDRLESISMLRYIRKIVSQSPLKSFVTAELNPGPSVSSDEEILRAFAEQGGRGYHVSCTCRMGTDARSVVDPQTRVRGVDGLRVVDTSIFPTLMSGTNAPAMATALRASQIILGETGDVRW